MVLLRLFGGASLESAKKPITGRSAQRRRVALLALLAVSRRGMTRDKLIGYLWAEHDAEKARRLLSESLYVLRKELGEDSIAVVGDELRLNPGVIECDVVAFEDAVNRDESEKAASMYVGPLLDGFYISDAPELERWIESERDRLARAYLRTLERLAEMASAEGRRDDAVTWCRRMAELDPFSGRFAVGLMQALEAAGHRAAALQHAQIHATLLREELDAEPDPAVAALAGRLRESPDTAWSPPETGLAAVSAVGSDAPGQGASSENGPAVDAPAESLRSHVPADDAERVRTGTVTFLFSDIEGSTALLRRLGPRYADLLATHHAIIRDALRRHHGREIDTAGDGFFIAFPRARDAINAAVAIQQRIAETDWPDGVTLRLRMGLHTGEPAYTNTGFVGLDVHRAARICALAGGGRILLSSVTRELLGGDLPAGPVIRDYGRHALKDIERPEHLWEIELPELASTLSRRPPTPASYPVTTQFPQAAPTVAAEVAAPVAQGGVNRPRNRGLRRRTVVLLLLLLALIVASGVVSLIVRNRADAPPAFGSASDSDRVIIALPPFQCACERDSALMSLRKDLATTLPAMFDGLGVIGAIPVTQILVQQWDPALIPDVSRVAAHFDATHVVVGTIARIPRDSVRIAATLHRRNAPTAVTTVNATGPTDDSQTLAESLALGLIEALIGEQPGREFTAEALRVTNAAAQAPWIEGEYELAAGRYARAADAFSRAVIADTSFAHGYYRLSMVSEWNLDFLRAHRAAEQAAVVHASAARPAQALLFRAWQSLIEGRVDAARNDYDRLLSERPEHVEAWYGRAELAAHFGPVRGEAISVAKGLFEKVIELITPIDRTGAAPPPNYGDALHHLLEFAAAERDTAKFNLYLSGVDATSDQWLAWQAVAAFGFGDDSSSARMLGRIRRELNEQRIGTAAVRVGTSLGDLTSAHAIAEILADLPGTTTDWRAGARLMMAGFDFGRGRVRDAFGNVALAVPDEPAWAHEFDALFALPGYVALSEAELTRVRDDLRNWNLSQRSPSLRSFFGVHALAHPYLRPYLLGLLNLRLNDVDAAVQNVREIELNDPSPDTRSLWTALSRSLRAHILLANGEADVALSRLENITLDGWMEQVGFSPFYSRAYDRLVIAELYREAGNYDQALQWYQSLTEGYEVLFVAPAHYRMATILRERGDIEDAEAHMREFDRLWQDADPEALEALMKDGRW